MQTVLMSVPQIALEAWYIPKHLPFSLSSPHKFIALTRLDQNTNVENIGIIPQTNKAHIHLVDEFGAKYNTDANIKSRLPAPARGANNGSCTFNLSASMPPGMYKNKETMP